MSKSIHSIVFVALVVLAPVAATQSPGALAEANGRTYTSADLSAEVRSHWEKRDENYAVARERLFSQMVVDVVLELEAKARNTTAAKLVDEVKRMVTDPSEAQIKAVYDANREELENKPLADVRKPIIEFLRRDPEQSALKRYVDDIAVKHKIVYHSRIDTPGLKPGDPLFTVGGRTVTLREFEDKYRPALYDARADVFDEVKAELESTVLSALISAEAAALTLDTQTYIAREITDKMRDFSDDERADLENALKRRLFAKYKVRFLIAPPPPVVQNISVDDDPALGPVGAPVTVVMFGDFQCPACARTHPVLQKVIAEFPRKVRFVARDYPLENIHKNAFIAALAAGAANAQGKFFEFGELLYRNQDALDAASLKRYAAQVGLNARRFELDFTSARTAAEVRKDMAEARSYGVTSTPTIFVNGVKVRRNSAEDFREAIETALSRR